MTKNRKLFNSLRKNFPDYKLVLDSANQVVEEFLKVSNELDFEIWVEEDDIKRGGDGKVWITFFAQLDWITEFQYEIIYREGKFYVEGGEESVSLDVAIKDIKRRFYVDLQGISKEVTSIIEGMNKSFVGEL